VNILDKQDTKNIAVGVITAGVIALAMENGKRIIAITLILGGLYVLQKNKYD
jgi:hypothetical protein